MSTKIEWAEQVWNPVTGCTKVSAGCKNCYAERMATRLRGRHGYPADEPFRVTLHPGRLDEPMRWRKPRRVFVNSMSDLFHEYVPDEFIDRVFAVMACAPQHQFLVLTKRPNRMRDWCQRIARGPALETWPLPNVWLGVSAEDQLAADRRIPILLDTPAAVRFVSAEPLLEPVVLIDYLPDTHDGHRDPRGGPWLDWVIVGGESGSGARRCDVKWVRAIVGQCQAAGVSVFVKQLGAHPTESGDFDAKTGPVSGPRLRDRKGGDPDEWPEDLRVREHPPSAV